MSAAVPMPDPFYRDSAIFEWAQRYFVPLFDATLHVNPSVRHPAGVDHDSRKLYLPPGLGTIDIVYEKVCRSILCLHGGSSWAPEFSEDPQPVDQNRYADNVVPLWPPVSS